MAQRGCPRRRSPSRAGCIAPLLGLGWVLLCPALPGLLPGAPAAPGASVAWAAPGGKAKAPRLFASRRRSRFWKKRCRRDRRRGLRRADVLETVRRAPVSLFAAMGNSPLYRLALQGVKRLDRQLAAARKRPRGLAKRLRLGQLCYARGMHHGRMARRADLRLRQAKARSKGVDARLLAARARERRLARIWLERALRHYQAIVAMGHGAIKHQAGPLFRVASLSMELATHPANRRLVKQRLKYAKLVLASLSSLLKHHSRSKYIELALLAKGAMYYHLGQYAEATKVLRQVRKWYSREAPYAMYLLGWSLFRGGHPAKARIHLRAATRSSRSSPALVRVAREDLVLVTSYLGKPRQADRYFRSSVKGRNKAPARRMLRRLARVCLARGERKAAVWLYRSFLERWPKHKQACLWVRTLEGLLGKRR